MFGQKDKKEKKPRSEKQKENDLKLKEKFRLYHENKKIKANILEEAIKEVEQEINLAIKEDIRFPSVDDMIQNIERNLNETSLTISLN